MNIAYQPLAQCPACRYDLTGLPSNHRCPECGLEYGDTLRVWRPGVSRIVLLRIVAACVWFYQGSYLVLQLFLDSIQIWKPVHFMSRREIVERFVWFFLATYFLMFPRPIRLLIVSKEGVFSKRRFGRLQKSSWADLVVVEDPVFLYRIRVGSHLRQLPGVESLGPLERKQLNEHVRVCLLCVVDRQLADESAAHQTHNTGREIP